MVKHPAIYAHRLGGGNGPECSRAALEATLELGVDGLETDVVLTADGEVFALHDPILSISTDGQGWAHQNPARELRRLHLRDRSGGPSDEHPMSLPELLQAMPSEIPIQLDVKAYADPALARRTATRACEILLEHGTADRAEVISFFTDACTATVHRGLTARLVAWADYAPLALVQWVRERGFVGVAVEGFIFHRELARALHDAGLSISVGAINSGDQLRTLLPMDPDIVVSDRPHEIRPALDRPIDPQPTATG